MQSQRIGQLSLVLIVLLYCLFYISFIGTPHLGIVNDDPFSVADIHDQMVDRIFHDILEDEHGTENSNNIPNDQLIFIEHEMKRLQKLILNGKKPSAHKLVDEIIRKRKMLESNSPLSNEDLQILNDNSLNKGIKDTNTDVITDEPEEPIQEPPSQTKPPAASSTSVEYIEKDGMMIAGNHVFSGEGCQKLGDQCSVAIEGAAALCASFGSRCVGYTCNKERGDCQLRGEPIYHETQQRYKSYYKPGLFEIANKLIEEQNEIDGKKLRNGRGKTAAKGFDFNGVCGKKGYKCVVSYGLYGSNPKYTEGAVTNAELVHTIFPGWVCRFYHDDTVPTDILNKLTSAGAELIKIDNIHGGIAGMFWRFLVAGDDSVDRYIIRDTDSRLNKREKYAVDEWLKSGFSVHSIRDHPNHNRPLNGGMWGGTKGSVKNIEADVRAASRGHYGADLDFLTQNVWPQIEYDQIAHDSYSCQSHKNSFPFPTERKDFEHVGQVFENGLPRQGDITCCLVNNPAPEQCRKKKEWLYG